MKKQSRQILLLYPTKYLYKLIKIKEKDYFMADGILRVTPERLQATASSFESTGNTVRNLTQQMTSIVTGLSGQVWSGEAATSYVTKFNGLQDDIERIHKMIQEHSKDLQEVAQQFITTENANKEMASSLSSDVIV